MYNTGFELVIHNLQFVKHVGSLQKCFYIFPKKADL